jgi:hypothetical protein
MIHTYAYTYVGTELALTSLFVVIWGDFHLNTQSASPVIHPSTKSPQKLNLLLLSSIHQQSHVKEAHEGLDSRISRDCRVCLKRIGTPLYIETAVYLHTVFYILIWNASGFRRGAATRAFQKRRLVLECVSTSSDASPSPLLSAKDKCKTLNVDSPPHTHSLPLSASLPPPPHLSHTLSLSLSRAYSLSLSSMYN